MGIQSGGAGRLESAPGLDPRKVTPGPLPSARPRRWRGTRRVALALSLTPLAACEPPDVPPVVNPDLPQAALEFLEPDRTRTFRIEPGVVYREIRSGPNPWVVHLLEVELDRCELGLRVEGTANDSIRFTVAELARRAEPGVIAAVNGDFYTPEDRPLGTEASGGRIQNRGSGVVLAWRPGASPWIGIPKWSGDSLQLGDWAIVSAGADGRTEVVGGYPALLKDGEWVGDLLQVDRPAFATQRHPRTAVGYDDRLNRLWLVVVDGRRGGVAEGMSLPELASFLQTLGARLALNLDGGGSSVMVIRGQAVNRPSDFQGPRPVVNALVLRSDDAYCDPADAEAD
ncbi:MAG: phosphodiester glycosidase family protein [Gemmatimonadota bacterium]